MCSQVIEDAISICDLYADSRAAMEQMEMLKPQIDLQSLEIKKLVKEHEDLFPLDPVDHFGPTGARADEPL